MVKLGLRGFFSQGAGRASATGLSSGLPDATEYSRRGGLATPVTNESLRASHVLVPAELVGLKIEPAESSELYIFKVSR